MKALSIREQLHQYIGSAPEKKLKEIYTMVEEDIVPYNKWNDKEFVTEMNRRMQELETGKVKGSSWEEVKKRVEKKTKAAKQAK